MPRIVDRELGERLSASGAVVIEGQVISATGYAYERPDGVMVIPIGALAP